MKNKLLILLMFLLPWQALTAAERHYAHVIGGGQSPALFVQHYTEHVEQILHHHDDDGAGEQSHQDDTQKSARHLADVDHGFSMNILLPVPPVLAWLPDVRVAPVPRANTFYNRTTLPPLRPPRVPA